MSAICSDAGCLCVPSEPLTVLGVGSEVIHEDRGLEEVLYFARQDDEVWASFPELAQIRQTIATTYGGSADWYGTTLDESDVTALIEAMHKHTTGEQLQPLWPIRLCACGVDGIALIDGEVFCHPCAEGYSEREQEASA